MLFPHVGHSLVFPLVLTTNLFKQASIISKQRGEINRKFAKLRVLFPAADTQYMTWKGTYHPLHDHLRKRQLFYSFYLLSMRKKNLQHEKRAFLQLSQNSARVLLPVNCCTSLVCVCIPGIGHDRKNRSYDEKNSSFPCRQGMCVDREKDQVLA